jgi:hypothetical protein
MNRSPKITKLVGLPSAGRWGVVGGFEEEGKRDGTTSIITYKNLYIFLSGNNHNPSSSFLRSIII